MDVSTLSSPTTCIPLWTDHFGQKWRVLFQVPESVVASFPGLEIEGPEAPALPGFESGEPFVEPGDLIRATTQNQMSVAVGFVFVADERLEMALGMARQVPDEPGDIVQELHQLCPVGFGQSGENLRLKIGCHTLNRATKSQKP